MHLYACAQVLGANRGLGVVITDPVSEVDNDKRSEDISTQQTRPMPSFKAFLKLWAMESPFKFVYT